MSDQNQVVKLPNKSEKKSLITSRWEPEDKLILSNVIARVFDAQKQYGKTSGQIENIVAAFCWALGGYPLQKVIDGIREYILRKPDIPTPSDIKNIIDPYEEPFRPDWKIYDRFKKLKDDGGAYALNLEEENYMKSCEAYSLARANR